MEKAQHESKLRGKLAFFESLRNRVVNLLNKEKEWGKDKFIQIAEELLKAFNRECEELNKLVGCYEIAYISPPSTSKDLGKFLLKQQYHDEWYSKLYTLLPEIDKAIGILNSQLTALSGTQAMELRKLREDLKETLSKLPNIYEKNMEEAIKAGEKGYFLSSALISSRIIAFILDQIPGKGIKDKIKNLKDTGLVTEKGEMTAETIMKADKKARNYFSHDLKAFPDSSEALELLGSCCRLLKLLGKIQRNKLNRI